MLLKTKLYIKNSDLPTLPERPHVTGTTYTFFVPSMSFVVITILLKVNLNEIPNWSKIRVFRMKKLVVHCVFSYSNFFKLQGVKARFRKSSYKMRAFLIVSENFVTS